MTNIFTIAPLYGAPVQNTLQSAAEGAKKYRAHEAATLQPTGHSQSWQEGMRRKFAKYE